MRHRKAGPRTTGAFRARFLNRLHARLAGRARAAGGFVSQPEPRTSGSHARGKQLVAGNFLFAGFLVEGPGLSIWDLPAPDPTFAEELQGCAWLDDLAALGDGAARARAQDWVAGWIARHGRGEGPGWTPDLTARRLMRFINHAIFLLAGRDRAWADAYFRSLAQQTIFLSRRWQSTAPGLPRFEALTGLVYAGLSLIGMDGHVRGAAAALGAECRAEIDAQGGIPTRNPEELLEVFALLTWAASALADAGRTAHPDHLAAIARIAPCLRTLRHADGGLARFHGGGRGAAGRLDRALAESGIKPAAHGAQAMGYARLSAGRSTVIVDADRPPQGAASANAHASTLALELTSGRRPLIVSCGSGAAFGPDWHRAGRATPSHSTLCIEGLSSARLAPARRLSGAIEERLADGPVTVGLTLDIDSAGHRLSATQDGYVASHGLTHQRDLLLAPDGRALTGIDTLETVTEADRATFDRALDQRAVQGVPFEIRFHLHPDVDASLDLGGTAVSLALKSGEIWIFRHDGLAEMTLEPSVYLETGRLKPRAARQIVLRARVLDHACQIGWTLAKATVTPQAIRDTAPNEAD